LVSLIRLFFLLTLLSGCQLGYLLHVSYNHLSLLNHRQPINDILMSGSLTPEQKRKIEITQRARLFAFNNLKLKESRNYSEYVDLKRPYVTYTVTAAQKWQLQPYLWSFPFIGKAPYKGFYSEEKAQAEANELKKKNLDTSVRGVSAYSTLGKMTDPLLSSMLNYKEHTLVNIIIHELVHTTVFIKDNIDFNERLAVFVANKGTELFYLNQEGPQSPTLQLIRDENEDDQVFSDFMTQEVRELKEWYARSPVSAELPADEREKLRQERLQQIADKFHTHIQPRMKTKSYEKIFRKTPNNAELSLHNTYMGKLDVFEKVYQKEGADIGRFLAKCAELNNSNDPEKELEKWAQSTTQL
jgi:predicted aminopeptidase